MVRTVGLHPVPIRNYSKNTHPSSVLKRAIASVLKKVIKKPKKTGRFKKFNGIGSVTGKPAGPVSSLPCIYRPLARKYDLIVSENLLRSLSRSSTIQSVAYYLRKNVQLIRCRVLKF